MREWEVEYISSNLDTLIRKTICNASLKVGLQTKGLITDEEEQLLTATGKQGGNFPETKLLYELLMTRKDAYSGLLQVLEKTRQSDAWDVLYHGFLQGQAKHLLDLDVNVFGKIRKVKDAFPTFSSTDAMEVLKSKDIQLEYDTLGKNDSAVLILDVNLPETPKLYLERLISNQFELDPKLFTLDCEDIFVFEGIKRLELAELAKPYIIRSSSQQLDKITSRHIFLENKEHWSDLVEIAKSPIHLITKHVDNENTDHCDRKRSRDCLLLPDSTKYTSIVRENCVKTQRSKAAYISEEMFVNSVIYSDTNGACVCDFPGTGKSSLLKSLPNKIWQCVQKSSTVIFIELADFSKYLRTASTSSTDQQDLCIILKYALGTSLGASLLCHHAKSSNFKFYIVLDGYDEIFDTDINNTKMFLQRLIRNNDENMKLVLSSRTHKTNDLESLLGVVCFEILPFGTNDKVKYLVGHWQKADSKSNIEALTRYAKNSVDQFQTVLNACKKDVLGAPLMCYLLAVVNERQARIFSTKEMVPFDTTSASIHSIPAMYDAFVDSAFKKIFEFDAPLEVDTETLKNNVVLFHTREAIKLLYPETLGVFEKQFKLESVDLHPFIILQMGILRLNGPRFEFIHRTFAEYFTGKLFGEFWTRRNSHAFDLETDYLQSVGVIFIKKPLGTVKADRNHGLPMNHRHLRAMRGYRFQNLTTLTFMNHFVGETCPWQRLNIQTSLFRESFDKGKMNELEQFDSCLSRVMYPALLASIKAGLDSVVVLLVNLAVNFFSSNHLISLLSVKATEDIPHMRALVSIIGKYCSPEVAQVFYDETPAPIQKILRHDCRYLMSPLAVSIEYCDLDKCIFYRDRVPLPQIRILFASLFGCELTDAQFKSRLEILETLLSSVGGQYPSLTTEEFAYLANTGFDWQDINLNLLISVLDRFIPNGRTILRSLSHQKKAEVLQNGFKYCDDLQLLKVFLVLFGNVEDTDKVVTAAQEIYESNDSGEDKEINLEIEKFINNCINVVDARNCFDNLRIDSYSFYFKFLQSTSFLRNLLHIREDFSSCNIEKENYLHFAITNSNVKWTRYLIQKGHDLNQPDADGNTPLLYLPLKYGQEKAIILTEILVQNGADVYAVNKYGDTVAHMIARSARRMSNLKCWREYAIEKKFDRLWTIKNSDGKAPLEYLYGDDEVFAVNLIRWE